MCDTFGPRFTGSKNLEDAIDWCLAEMKKAGFQNVRGEAVRVGDGRPVTPVVRHEATETAGKRPCRDGKPAAAT